MNPDLIILFTGEIIIILALYRFLLRDWVIAKWEEKIEEEGWLIVKLEPVIDEIEDRMHDKMQQFQDSFFGSVGQMVKKGKELDPMNNLRKAVKSGDWASMLLEYTANKSGLSQYIPTESDNRAVKEGESRDETPLKPSRMRDLLHK
jgi:hypothetical protein